MKITKILIRYFIIFCFSFVFAIFFSQIIKPKSQVFIDLDKYSENGVIDVAVYNEKIKKFESKDRKTYKDTIKVGKEELAIEFYIENSEIVKLKINNEDFSDKIVKISNITSSEYYKNVYCIKLNNNVNIWLTISLLAVFFYIFKKMESEIFIRNKHNKNLMFLHSAIDAVGKKSIILSFIIAIASIIIYAGCDLNVISESVIMHLKGVDFYQMFACFNKAKGVSLLMWQYDGSMLLGYSVLSYISYPVLKFFNPNSYHFIQVFLYKFINIGLCNLTILSIINYLIDKKKLSIKKAKWVYYLSIFNPLTFYVAIIFIQFDMLPAYALVLGILLMDKLKDSKYTSAFLLAFGLSCKMTMWLLIPAYIILEVYLFVKEKKYFENIQHFLLVTFLLAIFVIIPRILSTPVSMALTGLEQSKRIWFTTLNYAPTLFLYISIASILITFIYNYYDLSEKMRKENIILFTIVSFAIITFAFSYSTISTPSFLLQTIGAYVIFIALSDNKLSVFLTSILLLIITIEYSFAPEGDITASLIFFNKTPLFTTLQNKMIETNNYVLWKSLIFTISHSVMFSFIMIFTKLNKKLKENNF